ncbi:hypothetical protein TNCV_2185471 [Trichonephila clavipes]|nr:hypothetical protein TNCV_2185471 [Trichonephila clavipes]
MGLSSRLDCWVELIDKYNRSDPFTLKSLSTPVIEELIGSVIHADVKLTTVHSLASLRETGVLILSKTLYVDKIENIASTVI